MRRRPGKLQNQNQALESENERLRRQIEQLERQRDELEKERDGFQQQRDQLEKQRDQLEQQREQLEEQVEQLEEELEACRRAGYRQAAPFRREERRRVAKALRKRPGRRPGHTGHYRTVPEHLDESVEVALAHCPRCQRPVSDLRPRTQYIEEIPKLRPRVSQVITYRGICSRCGPVESVHPLQSSRAQGAAQVQLGPRALALAAELNKAQGLSMRKTCQVLENLVGLKLSAGGLSQALDRVANRVRFQQQQLLTDLREAPAVFVDETSWWVGEPGWWLWAFTTPETTLYAVEPSRGSQVVEETLGESFSGTLVSDCLASYDPPSYKKHKCIAHHLKAISQARDGPDTRDPSYLDQWSLFFKTVIATHSLLVESPGSHDLPALIPQLECWRDRLLAEVPCQPGDLTIQKRLEKQRPHLLGCLDNTAAEPTNNRAERALRPAVIARKISCGNKTTRGKRTWETLASLAATSKQRNLSFVDSLAEQLSLSR
jgi:hypothetical protein